MNIMDANGAIACAECAKNARNERDQLKAENAKLVMKLNAEHIVRQNVERENAKLRELVKAMEPFLCCMPFASCNTLAANVRKRMRELGVDA